MRETIIHQKFDAVFHEYQLLKPDNRRGGWPDRGVHVFRSRLIWVEIKTVTVRPNNKILVSNFEKEQGVFMFFWQKNHGDCFLLVAVLNRKQNLSGYAIIQPSHESNWLNVRAIEYDLAELPYVKTMEMVSDWFEERYT